MNTLARDKIDILLIDPAHTARNAIRNLLIDNGFSRISAGSNMEDIKAQFLLGMPDLLISDIKLPDGNFNELIYGLRHHKVGTNPFMPVIATAWSPTTDDVRAVVQSGADDLITKPMSANQVIQRIEALIKARKPFVVTSAYIGPDRRKDGMDRDRGTKIDPFHVPNTLRAKAIADNEFDARKIQTEIDACIEKVNLEKLNRHAHQISWLVEKIVPSMTSGTHDDETREFLNRLLYVSEDVTRRMIGTPFEHVSELCMSLIDVTQRIIDAGHDTAPRDVELLKPLSQSIERGFDLNDQDAQSTAHKISETVSTKSTP